MNNNSGDATQIDALAAYIEHSCNIPKFRIKKEHYILLERRRYTLLGVYTKIGAVIFSRTIIHRPDILILDPKLSKIRLLIELDGSSHDHIKKNRRKTRTRNTNYHHARIPYFVINIKKYREEHKSWFDAIDRCLKHK